MTCPRCAILQDRIDERDETIGDSIRWWLGKAREAIATGDLTVLHAAIAEAELPVMAVLRITKE